MIAKLILLLFNLYNKNVSTVWNHIFYTVFKDDDSVIEFVLILFIAQ